MIWAAAVLAISALLMLLWHMQKPRPRRIAISFARFVPPLPQAPAGWSRIALTRPRDLSALLCLLAAVGFGLWALLDAGRNYRAALPDHLGLRVVFDRSGSMAVADGGESRQTRALKQVEAARLVLANAGVGSLCIEMLGVGAAIGPALPLALTGPLPADDMAPLSEGAEPARLLEAARRPANGCALTHVLVITDLPPQPADLGGPLLLWDQIGAAVGNNGLRALALRPSAFGQTTPEIRLEGVNSGRDAPPALVLTGPAGPQNAVIYPDPEAEGRWYAIAVYNGAGEYTARLPAGDGYPGDDRISTRLDMPLALAVDWQLGTLPRPASLAAGGAADPLVTELAQLAPQDLARPLMLTYPGFDSKGAARIGPFRESLALLSALNFDALEVALPAPYPAPLPPGFVPMMTDDQGGVLIAQRADPPGLILPAPRLDLPEPQRSLSLTLFFSGLADLIVTPPRAQAIRWIGPDEAPIPDAWRESLTGRPAGAPADLAVLAGSSATPQQLPFWPWAVLAALAALLAEKLLRLARRREVLQ
ncbi:MAG: hypothetical protein CVT70_16870 [Alphaproteobacteria bacterium HGW-Alphaproteobacteria-1]|jgi:hypothetical protein|nr:MAG: hypothetical protein CVT70_16870 [Alphaproteobacteria bacterium HGW-Alphaproteobacteria-1]